MDGNLFEARFIELLVREVEALKQDGVSFKNFARRAFPGVRSPENKWQRIKNMSYGIGKKQNITLSDAYHLVTVLGLDLARFVARVLDDVEEKPPIPHQRFGGTGNIQIGGSVNGGTITRDTTIRGPGKHSNRR
jgi:hypothetical protein